MVILKNDILMVWMHILINNDFSLFWLRKIFRFYLLWFLKKLNSGWKFGLKGLKNDYLNCHIWIYVT